MSFVYNLFVVVHFVALAGLLGGWLVQLRSPGERQVSSIMVHSALTMVLTGLILVGLAEMVDDLGRDIDNAKIAVKLLVALAVAVLAWINRRRALIPDGLYLVIGGLTLVNVIVAVFWN